MSFLEGMSSLQRVTQSISVPARAATQKATLPKMYWFWDVAMGAYSVKESKWSWRRSLRERLTTWWLMDERKTHIWRPFSDVLVGLEGYFNSVLTEDYSVWKRLAWKTGIGHVTNGVQLPHPLPLQKMPHGSFPDGSFLMKVLKQGVSSSTQGRHVPLRDSRCLVKNRGSSCLVLWNAQRRLSVWLQV